MRAQYARKEDGSQAINILDNENIQKITLRQNCYCG